MRLQQPASINAFIYSLVNANYASFSSNFEEFLGKIKVFYVYFDKKFIGHLSKASLQFKILSRDKERFRKSLDKLLFRAEIEFLHQNSAKLEN